MHSPFPSGPPNLTVCPYPRAPDPRFVPLPSTSDADLTHGPTIAQATGYSAAEKVAGSRHASGTQIKGKRKREDFSDVDNASDISEPPIKQNTHGGRRLGAGNYGDPELKELLRLVESVLPFGQNGWKQVHARYTTWANKNKKPLRDAKSLETKFKTVRYDLLTNIIINSQNSHLACPDEETYRYWQAP